MSRLKEFRKKSKISQEELAKSVNVSVRHIAFIESGGRTPSLDLAFKIAKVLNGRVDDIFSQLICTNSTGN